MFVTSNVYLNIMFLHIACGFELLHNPFKGETDNIVKLLCFLCLPKKDVSPFANSPSNIRQHVGVRTESYPSFFFFIRLHYTCRTLHITLGCAASALV